MYLGKDKHILTFPIQEGKVLNVVAFASDRTPSADDPVWDSDNWIVPSTEQEMLTGWEGWSKDCLTILGVSRADAFAHCGVIDAASLDRTSRSRRNGDCMNAMTCQLMREGLSASWAMPLQRLYLTRARVLRKVRLSSSHASDH